MLLRRRIAGRRRGGGWWSVRRIIVRDIGTRVTIRGPFDRAALVSLNVLSQQPTPQTEEVTSGMIGSVHCSRDGLRAQPGAIEHMLYEITRQ